MNLIAKDISRCSNNNCVKKENCKRWLQLAIDITTKQGNVYVSNFNENPCNKFLKNE